MKFILLFLMVLLGSQVASANTSKNLKVHIVTWDNNRFTGRIDSISSNSIYIKSRRGQVVSFTASQTKNLKVWRSGIVLPITLASCVAVPLLLSKGDSERTCTDAMFVILGVPAGAIAGLVVGDLIATKFNRRRMHLSNFDHVIGKIQ